MRRDRIESNWHGLYAVNEVGAQPVDVTVEARVADPPEDLLEHYLQLQARQVRPQAEMLADTKGAVLIAHVLALVAGYIEYIRLAENRLIAVSRRVIHLHAVAFLDVLATQFDIFHGGAAKSDNCRTETQEFLDGIGQH